MSFDRLRIEQLYTHIEHKRTLLAQQRLELAKLQAELDTFAQLYDRLVGKLQDELDSVWQAIENAQMADRPYVSDNLGDSLWGPYGSLEEAFDAKYRRGPQPDSAQFAYVKVTANDKELKLLYRKLARQYHPDTTTDPVERQRRTVLMAQINAAYRAKNYKELRSLEVGGGKRPVQPAAAPEPAPPTAQQTFNELTKLIQKLDDDIDWVKIEHQRLMTCPLMQFKIEYSLARSQGRDMLREMASSLRADISDARRHLASLKRR